MARRQHAFKQFTRQRFTGFHVGRQPLQHRPFPAEVFHELAGQFNGIALHPRDAGHGQVFHLREHVVQAVPKLVEERDDLVVRQQRRPIPHGRREVADQVCHGELQLAFWAAPAAAAGVHPGARLLARAGMKVQVKAGHGLLAAPHAKEANAVVPHRRRFSTDGYIEQGLNQAKEPLQHTRLGEVLSHLFAAEGVTGLLELLGDKRAVPGLQLRQAQMLAGIPAQFSQLLVGKRSGTARQVAHKSQDIGRRPRHVGHQGQMGVRVESEQAGFFQPQLQQLLNHGRVVQFWRAKLAGTGDIGAVKQMAQLAVHRVGHHRLVARGHQGQFVAFTLLSLRRGARGLAHVLRYTGHLRLGGPIGEGIGRVQHVLPVGLGQGAGTFLDAGVTLARLALQFGAAQDKVAQGVAHHPAARWRQHWALAGRDGLVFGVQPFVGAKTRAEVNDAAQVAAVLGTQFRRVCNALQVGDVTPSGHELFHGHIQQQRQGVVIGCYFG